MPKKKDAAENATDISVMMEIKSEVYDLSILFTGPILGSQPGKDTPSSDYLRTKVQANRPDLNIKDETGTLPEELEKGTTGFHRINGKPGFLNYQVKGMLKEAGDVLNGIEGFKALRRKVDNCMFVLPRQIPINGKLSENPLERPLRAETMKGPRTSLARSEMIEAGASIKCQIEIVQTPRVKLTEALLRKLLDYATRKGLGQWRNSGIYGQFEYTLKKV